jgi:hypothetical protein
MATCSASRRHNMVHSARVTLVRKLARAAAARRQRGTAAAVRRPHGRRLFPYRAAALLVLGRVRVGGSYPHGCVLALLQGSLVHSRLHTVRFPLPRTAPCMRELPPFVPRACAPHYAQSTPRCARRGDAWRLTQENKIAPPAPGHPRSARRSREPPARTLLQGAACMN